MFDVVVQHFYNNKINLSDKYFHYKNTGNCLIFLYISSLPQAKYFVSMLKPLK